jgi:hypothetical protein
MWVGVLNSKWLRRGLKECDNVPFVRAKCAKVLDLLNVCHLFSKNPVSRSQSVGRSWVTESWWTECMCKNRYMVNIQRSYFKMPCSPYFGHSADNITTSMHTDLPSYIHISFWNVRFQIDAELINCTIIYECCFYFVLLLILVSVHVNVAISAISVMCLLLALSENCYTVQVVCDISFSWWPDHLVALEGSPQLS